MRIAIAADHAGYELKNVLADHLAAAGHEVEDLGTMSDDSVDYPDYGAAVARAVVGGEVDRGIAICGSGIGICMAASKIVGARAATVHDVTSAALAKRHNDANIVCLGARFIGPQVAMDAVDAFLDAEFEGGRHQRRIDKLSRLEEPLTPAS